MELLASANVVLSLPCRRAKAPIKHHARVAQWIERSRAKGEVTGSIPVPIPSPASAGLSFCDFTNQTETPPEC